MHSEDDDYNLPIAFQQRRHEPRVDTFFADLMKNWRLKERVSCFVFASVPVVINFTIHR